MTEKFNINRRRFLQGAGASMLLSALPFNLAFADAPGNKRLFVVILRGAMDGLHSVVPYGDLNYASARGAMALPVNSDTMVALDNRFALHKSLAGLAPLYQQKELLIMHAAAMPYRERSHFDAQNVLENGSDKPGGLSTGWLNRATAALQGSEAIAIGPTIPLILRGNARTTSWAPSVLPAADTDFMSRVAHMYEPDPLFKATLEEANGQQAMGGMSGERGAKSFIPMMQQAAAFMAAPNGPRLGSIDLTGWDTHTGQGQATGRMANAMSILNDGLLAYRQAMGTGWKDTAVLIVTEFGRTVKGNGSGGTDHGTGTASFLLGGSVAGGRIVGEWPGLAQLYQDRDLIPANDLRGLLKGTLNQHMGIADATLNDTIFPGSTSVNAPVKLFV